MIFYTECTPGFYSNNCSVECGQCFDGEPCDIFTGECPDLCAPGWQGGRCDIGKLFIIWSLIHLSFLPESYQIVILYPANTESDKPLPPV